jgi:RNase adapter protein RapZ
MTITMTPLLSDTPTSLVFITGPSGAGRTTAIHAFEDLGYEAIDNLPLSLVPRLIAGPGLGRPIALGLDVRNRDFSANALIEVIDQLTRDPAISLQVVYLDCSASELIRRFNQTRRRHPLAPQETPTEGVTREIDLLAPIRARADHLIDTSEMSPHELKAEIATVFAEGASLNMAVSVQSFSYKRGLPRGLDIVLDCRFLNNPHWQPDLRAQDGRNPAVAAFVMADPLYGEFFAKVHDLAQLLLPATRREGKAHLSIGFGCTGGKHRSVVLAEKLAKVLADSGWPVSIRHRELERWALTPPAEFRENVL